MDYQVEFKPRALKDLDSIQPEMAQRIVERISHLQNNLESDVKRLTNFTPSYRLRVGDYRALFEVESSRILVYRVVHRREVYR
jgi:mRNA interferase RelE/StbE